MRVLSLATRLTLFGKHRHIMMLGMRQEAELGGLASALDLVEEAVDASLVGSSGVRPEALSDTSMRESAVIAARLRKRLDSFKRSGRCRRCWLRQSICVCDCIQPLQLSDSIGRIFLIMHHKEICLTVDTAKIIFATFPGRALIVVNGLDNQPAELEMRKSIEDNKALVLFPSKDSVLAELSLFDTIENANGLKATPRDLIVLDGTWSQATKIHRSIPNTVPRIRLSENALAHLAQGNGKQLRPHPTQWKEVSTLEALRLLLVDLEIAGPDPTILSEYQRIADVAAMQQLGKKRQSPKYTTLTTPTAPEKKKTKQTQNHCP